MDARTIRNVQAAYYLASGIAPFVSRRAFEAVTGKKRDWWLVQMVGLLAVSIGATLAAYSTNDSQASALRRLSLFSAASFAAIDCSYGLRGKISGVYLLDAAVEAFFIGGALYSTR